jgi:streptogramin lyase
MRRGSLSLLRLTALVPGWIVGLVLPIYILAIGGAANAAPPAAAHWRFEEGVAPAVDASGNSNAGVVTGATYSTLAPWLHFGANTRSLFFDSDGDYVEIPAGAVTNLNEFASGITVEAMLRVAELPIPIDAAGHRLSYILWADDDAYSLVLVSDASGRTTLLGKVNFIGGGSGPCSTSVSAAYVNSATFSHVAMTYAAEVLELYIDGKLVDVASAPGGCGSVVGPVGFRNIVRLGSDETAVGFPLNDRTFRGWLDEARVTGEALDPSDFVRKGVDQLLVAVWSSRVIHRYDVATASLDQSWLTFGLHPNAMLIGPDGHLVVTNQTSDWIDRYHPGTGDFFGVFASGAGMDNPLTSRYGPDGRLYVNSQNPNQILRFDGTTGAYIDVFTTTPSAPLDHVFGPDGQLYVRLGSDVFRYDAVTAASLGQFTSGGPTGFGSVILFGPDGDLYVTIEDAVSRFDGATGAYISDFVTSGSGGLDVATGIAFGPGGDFYVSSMFGQEVLRYDGVTGAFIDVFASPGGQVRGLLFVPEPDAAIGFTAGLALLGMLAGRRAFHIRRRALRRQLEVGAAPRASSGPG